MTYELISLLETPTLPMAQSSARTKSAIGRIYTSDDFAVIVEENPICVFQAMEMMAQRSRTPPASDMQYLAAASVFYRKSKNPHGPSGRPIVVVALEHSPFSTEYDNPGFFARMFGARPRPKTLFVGCFLAGCRMNFGMRENDFSREAALDFLLEKAAEQVKLRASDFSLQCDLRSPMREQALS
jgi:hypothetical protein